MSKLLIHEHPLQVLPSLAVKIGLNEAVFLQQLHYWSDKSTNVKAGHKWVYNTYEGWLEQFPFWSLSTLRRTIKNLEDKNLIVTGVFNKMKLDKTKWYRVDYDELSRLESPSVQNEHIDGSEWTVEQSNLSRAIPEITTETSTETSTEKDRAAAEQLKNDFENRKKGQNLTRQVYQLYQSTISHLHHKRINEDVEDFEKYSDGNIELIRYAMERAAERHPRIVTSHGKTVAVKEFDVMNQRSGLALKMLRDWKSAGVKDLGVAKAFEESNNPSNKEAKSPKKSKVDFMQYVGKD